MAHLPVILCTSLLGNPNKPRLTGTAPLHKAVSSIEQSQPEPQGLTDMGCRSCWKLPLQQKNNTLLGT